ncbi:dihydroxyacetone kinase phosphoryl donor subunit DhaM [Enterococcus canis]|uniref:dihydroxyacetone kinase phosphoryl donor subunit DhaM n=1 Tax=Enterococcus canis TaxID=214095 RepID=UPI000835EB9B|nr:dihydroxyacetone kinase phosphoryl donor subunit DhaM [Enterococcus canis]
MSKGILLVSHVHEIAAGIERLIKEVAADVPIIVAAGLPENGVGTSFDAINQAISDLDAEEILAFYDLGSAKMNLEMAIEMSEKTIHLHDTAFVESAYTAGALLQAGSSVEDIEAQLAPLKVK